MSRVAGPSGASFGAGGELRQPASVVPIVSPIATPGPVVANRDNGIASAAVASVTSALNSAARIRAELERRRAEREAEARRAELERQRADEEAERTRKAQEAIGVTVVRNQDDQFRGVVRQALLDNPDLREALNDPDPTKRQKAADELAESLAQPIKDDPEQGEFVADGAKRALATLIFGEASDLDREEKAARVESASEATVVALSGSRTLEEFNRNVEALRAPAEEAGIKPEVFDQLKREGGRVAISTLVEQAGDPEVIEAIGRAAGVEPDKIAAAVRQAGARRRQIREQTKSDVNRSVGVAIDAGDFALAVGRSNAALTRGLIDEVEFGALMNAIDTERQRRAVRESPANPDVIRREAFAVTDGVVSALVDRNAIDTNPNATITRLDVINNVVGRFEGAVYDDQRDAIIFKSGETDLAIPVDELIRGSVERIGRFVGDELAIAVETGDSVTERYVGSAIAAVQVANFALANGINVPGGISNIFVGVKDQILNLNREVTENDVVRLDFYNRLGGIAPVVVNDAELVNYYTRANALINGRGLKPIEALEQAANTIIRNVTPADVSKALQRLQILGLATNVQPNLFEGIAGTTLNAVTFPVRVFTGPSNVQGVSVRQATDLFGNRGERLHPNLVQMNQAVVMPDLLNTAQALAVQLPAGQSLDDIDDDTLRKAFGPVISQYKLGPGSGLMYQEHANILNAQYGSLDKAVTALFGEAMLYEIRSGENAYDQEIIPKINDAIKRGSRSELTRINAKNRILLTNTGKAANIAAVGIVSKANSKDEVILVNSLTGDTYALPPNILGNVRRLLTERLESKGAVPQSMIVDFTKISGSERKPEGTP